MRAGLSFDAPLEPLVETDLDRPFMLMTADYTRETLPVAQFWSHLTGWRLTLAADLGLPPGGEIPGLEVVRPSLEDVYLSLIEEGAR